jgi:hypothetical protein
MSKYSPLSWIAKNDLNKSVLQERRANYEPEPITNIRISRKKFILQEYTEQVIFIIMSRELEE